MRIKNKQLYTAILCFGMIFCQFHVSSIAAQEDITSEISDSAKITKIEFEGNHLVNSEDIINVMNLRVGDTYSKDSVQESLKAIYKTGYFSEKMNRFGPF